MTCLPAGRRRFDCDAERPARAPGSQSGVMPPHSIGRSAVPYSWTSSTPQIRARPAFAVNVSVRTLA